MLTSFEAKNELVRIHPVDEIDRVCKIHDLCYLESGFGNKTCDDLFVYLMNELSFSLQPDCMQLAQNMKDFFRKLDSDEDKSQVSRIINLNFIFYAPLSMAWDMIFYPLHLASGLERSDRCISSEKRRIANKKILKDFIDSFRDTDEKMSFRDLMEEKLKYYENLRYSYNMHRDIVELVSTESLAINPICNDH